MNGRRSYLLELVDVVIYRFVWVVLQGESFVGVVDIFEGCMERDLQDLVVISYFGCRHRGEDRDSRLS